MAVVSNEIICHKEKVDAIEFKGRMGIIESSLEILLPSVSEPPTSIHSQPIGNPLTCNLVQDYLRPD